MLRGLSEWLVSYQFLSDIPSFSPSDTWEHLKMNVPEAAFGFQQATASLFTAAGKSERQGTTWTSHRAREAFIPWADCNKFPSWTAISKMCRSSQHICLHLCLGEEKLKYLLLENKGEKEPVNISQLKQESKRHRGSFCPQLMKKICRDLWHISCITAIPNYQFSLSRQLSPSLLLRSSLC